jgi:hypothetical protein
MLIAYPLAAIINKNWISWFFSRVSLLNFNLHRSLVIVLIVPSPYVVGTDGTKLLEYIRRSLNNAKLIKIMKFVSYLGLHIYMYVFINTIKCCDNLPHYINLYGTVIHNYFLLCQLLISWFFYSTCHITILLDLPYPLSWNYLKSNGEVFLLSCRILCDNSWHRVFSWYTLAE